MICTKCGHNNVAEARFCEECGSPLGGAAPSAAVLRTAAAVLRYAAAEFWRYAAAEAPGKPGLWDCFHGLRNCGLSDSLLYSVCSHYLGTGWRSTWRGWAPWQPQGKGNGDCRFSDFDYCISSDSDCYCDRLCNNFRSEQFIIDIAEGTVAKCCVSTIYSGTNGNI